MATTTTTTHREEEVEANTEARAEAAEDKEEREVENEPYYHHPQEPQHTHARPLTHVKNIAHKEEKATARGSQADDRENRANKFDNLNYHSFYKTNYQPSGYLRPWGVLRYFFFAPLVLN